MGDGLGYAVKIGGNELIEDIAVHKAMVDALPSCLCRRCGSNNTEPGGGSDRVLTQIQICELHFAETVPFLLGTRVATAPGSELSIHAEAIQ